ncbi:uracil-DNA glycosylase family protein [Sphingomonas sp. AX6]|uniref:uracil-DNA glycosylase family protein n=1 Tax=Sphingomonas sp. AX6 TaxID=2653171 RepID=UPI0012F0D5AA|nr:uracil-DNA glycosylase family protein [Sphingomonas sp. AX6]VXC94719.1 Uracil-DNA glycosylase [Sphingomonas sp. AX6]
MGADQHFDWHRQAASALEWWRDAGVDVLVDEAPRNWLATPAAKSAVTSPVAEAAPIAAWPDTIEAFVAWRLSDAAPDHVTGRMIAPIISDQARLMLLVDMPEDEDAESGQLVSGAAGRLLDRMLAAIDLDRSRVHLIPLCVVRPVSGRIASEMEAPLGKIARHFVRLLAPDAVLTLGTAASRAIVGTDDVGGRGGLRIVNHEGADWPIIASFHPRFLLERPVAKAESWKHLQLVRTKLKPGHE